MAEWKRPETLNEIEVAAGMPDALAILDAKGNVIGWDDTPCCRYLAEHGMPCSAECRERGHRAVM